MKYGPHCSYLREECYSEYCPPVKERRTRKNAPPGIGAAATDADGRGKAAYPIARLPNKRRAAAALAIILIRRR